MTQVHEWGQGVGPAAAAIEADEAKGTVTTTHSHGPGTLNSESGTLDFGPFETEAEAWDVSDIPPELWSPWMGYSVYQKTIDGKWWRQFQSTTTLPPLEDK